MRQQVERDGEHMWLRQSVTFSVDGQSRTLEIGIPLRTGATPEEIEALLAEADAGMERIGRHLEARIARLSGGAAPGVPITVASSVPAPERSELPAASEPSEEPEPPAPAHAATPEVPPSSARPPASPATASPPAMPAPTSAPARTIAERSATTSPATEASAPARPVAPATPERTPTSTPAAARATMPPASTGTPMTIPEFIAAVQAEQGLNPKQAMERLGVKSLAGLNLREALEMLRRQALRDGTGPITPEAQHAPAPAPVPAPPAPAAAPSTPPRYFEEEDDAADIIFTEEDDEAEAAEYRGGPGSEDDAEYEDLDEVPDFGSPPAEPEPPASTPSAPAAATGAANASSASKEAAPETSRATRILTHMRGVRGGGAASTHQRTAFKNIVAAELGEPKVKALIAGIWRITPEKLGPEQLDALNNWGKRDTFAEDTELVLAAVKAERERERGGKAESTVEPSSAPESGSERSASTRAASRRASRAAPTGGA